MNDHNTLTKEWALDVLVGRVAKRFRGVDAGAERAVLAKKSRASLLHSVGAQWYGDLDRIDEDLMRYAYEQMTPAEQRIINQAG